MNPVLLEPSTELISQVVLLGRPLAEADAMDHERHKVLLRDTVRDGD